MFVLFMLLSDYIFFFGLFPFNKNNVRMNLLNDNERGFFYENKKYFYGYFVYFIFIVSN